MRDGRVRTIIGRAALAIAVAALGGWLMTEATGPARHAHAAATGGRCILCNAFGASNAPRICNTCNNKFNNRCILCNAFGASNLPRICNTCNNKY